MAKLQARSTDRSRIQTAAFCLVSAALLAAIGGCKGKDEAREGTDKAASQAPTAAVPAVPFPARPAARLIAPDIEFYAMRVGGSGPGRPMSLNLYLPAGRHDANSLPCVLIAPAGTAMYGSAISEGDRAEHYPYVRAGFAVMAYELSGGLANASKNEQTYADVVGPVKKFMQADGGLVNGHIAIDFILQRVPEVDPERLFACGHSSAAVVALNLAGADSRIHACCAYAARTDVEAWWNEPQLENLIPGFRAFATRKSPLRHADAINCPVYLFHADDDSLVPLADNQAFAEALSAAGKTVTFDRVERGDHYDSMINEGIPRGIEFMRTTGAKPLTPLLPPAKR